MLIKEQLCCVVSILGMGGLGETALARNLCNCSVVEAFPVPDTGHDQAERFSQLQILWISCLHNFQQLEMKQEAMPRLKIFSIEDCNTLYWIP
ncbi:hypothetical protein Dsin_026481 [Dipteronia sinensis]|uniref:Uncharacterized protein n=1 Tax=Dipteronia sinensis TaxID=43782 RepID=A0AAD9ZYE7_9ROSI|nr:hypothetical protein Dsin_026481 [Dipteronia sinensis]